MSQFDFGRLIPVKGEVASCYDGAMGSRCEDKMSVLS